MKIGLFNVLYPPFYTKKGVFVQLFYGKKGSKTLWNPQEKGVVFNSQNYDRYSFGWHWQSGSS